MRNYPESLRDQANQLAMAQSCGIHDGFSWEHAYAELTDDTLWDGTELAGEAESFTPASRFEGKTFDELAFHVETEALAIYEELKKAYDLGNTKPHDDLTFARYQGFYEYLTEGPDAGRTHASSADWNEAYDAGRNEASALSLLASEC